MKHPIYRWLLAFLWIGISPATQAQDTLSITLAQAEKLFLEKNFYVLAARYNVQAADAAIIQAKLYPNPYLSIDQGAYNKYTGKWFDVTKTGQTAISLQQLILLAGKRNKEVAAARINAEISQYQFYDLIRTLRYELRSAFYDLYYRVQSSKVYDEEIASIASLVNAYTQQFNKGNIAFKDLARLQALQFSLENERINLMMDGLDRQRSIGLLIGDSLGRTIKPLLENEADRNVNNLMQFSQLIDSALVNRYDLLAASRNVKFQQAQLALQRAYRIPDLTLGASYDRASSYIYNYNSITLGINLPFWNRNQGNIKVSQYRALESIQLQNQKELEVIADVKQAWSQWQNTENLYQNMSVRVNSDYDNLLDGIIRAYREHTISLLEFIDYYETYKQTKIQFNHLRNGRLNALENLNLATGSQLF